MDRDQPQVKEGMVSTKQVLQVPQGGKQVMKGVHAYMEHTDLPYCVFFNCLIVVSLLKIYKLIYLKRNIIELINISGLTNY